MSGRILIAGVGNIFLGDDAFGVEVVRELAGRALPAEVDVIDFGIRSYDLALALNEGYETVVLVDATPRGQRPGTLYLIEPDMEQLGLVGQVALDGHSLNPMSVLQLAEAFGGRPERLYVLGCEPAELGADDGRMGLSEPVQAAVPQAAERLERLVGTLLRRENKKDCGLASV